MKRMIRMLFLALAVALAAGCSHSKGCHCRAYQKKYRRPLAGTTWQLVQLYGRSVTAAPGAFTLVLSDGDGRISGRGACNRFSGAYATDRSRALTIGSLCCTHMACPGLEQEQRFFEALRTTTHYDMDGPLLLLLRNGELQAVLQALAE
ncbi:META domain-containing protein [uncultured Alistipes sp.]|uniref:META domain-containing protein n=1 Tax=uncultured Alistipes sp. TaxID=538949 RepID=UPI00272AD5BA|nr:META domain-containing protein [uncultured Alistipes sp.]